MVDITKCYGHECNKKETCYRFTSHAAEFWQSWFTPIATGDDCRHYIETTPLTAKEKKESSVSMDRKFN